MNGFSDYTKNALLNSLLGKTSNFGALASAPSLYLAIFAGASELSGGAYARKLAIASDFGSVSGGEVTTINDLEFPAASADWSQATDIKIVDASSGGNELAKAPLVNPSTLETFVGDAGTNILTIPNHGFSDDETVRVIGGDIPSGLSEATTYYIISATADTLQLSATQGGAAVSLTADGFGRIAKTAYKTVETGDTARFSAGSLTFSL